jgi:DNA-binding Lrp family transcriptional regulator
VSVATLPRAAELLSMLADRTRLRVLAELSRCGQSGATMPALAEALDIPLDKVRQSVARLVGLEVVERVGQNIFVVRLSGLRAAAAALDDLSPVTALLEEYPRLRGCFSHGRLVAMPSDTHGADFAEFLGRLVAVEGVVDEAEINRRLAVVGDPAALRRLMVDTGVLVRDSAGTAYTAA